MKHSSHVRVLTGLLIGLSVIGCGHSRLPESVGDGGLAGAGGMSGAGGAGRGAGGGGRAGSGGRTSTGASGTPPGVTAAPRVTCNNNICQVPGLDQYMLLASLAAAVGFPLPANGGGFLQTACCTKDNVCGLQVNSDCVPRPASDPVCPDINFFGITTPGCCMEPQGVCGLNGVQSGMGCVSAAALGGPANPMRCGSGLNENDGGDNMPIDAGR
jgi:hypothetical protein